MMVLAMDVIRDGASDGHKACARCNGDKPPFGEEHPKNIGETDAAFAADHPCRFVEAEDSVETMAVNQVAASIETRIAVTATEAKGK